MRSFGERLSSVEPSREGLPGASVSVILDGEGDSRLLLIERARREGDPWSGQIAFPGGKALPTETDAKQTAVRETKEEVGIDLLTSAKFLGFFGPFKTHTGTMTVTPVVFRLKERVEVKPNPEVASHRWVDVDSLLSPGAKSTYTIHFEGGKREMPAIRIGDYLVWGLTYRIISDLFA